MTRWITCRIGDLCTLRRGASPRPINNFISTEGVPWVKIADATESKTRFIEKTKEFIKEEGAKNSVAVTPGTLILSNSATPGLPKIMKINACVHDGWLVFDDFNGITRDFLYYLFLNERERLVQGANGSVFNNLKTDIVKNFIVRIPESIAIQNRIVSILSSIDDKIELNLKINETLEEMAMTLYKHWFVDFGPFQDGEFVESELGIIPKGWKVSSLKEFANILMGQSPKSEFYNQEKKGLPFHQGVKDFGARFPVHTVYCTQELRIANKGDILLSVRAPVGRINIANNKLVIGRGLSALHAKSGHNSFLLYTLKRIFAFEDQYGSGTVFNSINKKDIEQLKFIQPPQEVLDNFEKHVSKFDSLIESNTKEIEELQELRDYLLPRLLSGEIDLSQAEKQVEEVL